MAIPIESSPLDDSREEILREASAAAEASGPQREEDAGPARSFLVCSLGSEWYAVDLAHVRRVLRPAPIAQVSGAAAEVLGLMNCQGEVLCVLDLRRILGTSSARGTTTEGKLIVVLQHGGREAGFLVDSVEDVWELAASSILPVLESLDPSRARLFEGTVTRGGRFVGVLAPSMCLNP
ncbi:MAG: purine-binding chemotaxis protein CheW [Deltaproteobacteria bacterium]|nr:purine-binding chemotaxis protein CheW [Deltaproteobacteria bacterium]